MSIRRGFQYPLTLSNGGLAVSTDFDLLKEQIYSVLETRPLERVMATDYGTPSFIFESVQDAGVICEQIRLSLRTQIPEVEDFRVTGSIAEDGVMDIQIYWVADSIDQPPIAYKLTL